MKRSLSRGCEEQPSICRGRFETCPYASRRLWKTTNRNGLFTQPAVQDDGTTQMAITARPSSGGAGAQHCRFNKRHVVKISLQTRMSWQLLIAATLFLASCGTWQPFGSYEAQKQRNYERDLYECEREAAFAGAGSKRQVFDNCMKARGY